ncbi:type II toxin-antitoxin system VapC family toxin [Saccharopolyspora sp. ID03-671]|uniref:type II toxin-antitoxin system VapC family toxin n=1 Tax=Saccharopolyspora sp. ID03-671 TaxID=3073066 RepID=UPI003245EBAF
MIYLDTAALIKLVRPELESDALGDWLESQPDVPLVASALVEVEMPRALRRCAPELMGSVPAVMKRIGVYDIDEVVRATAAAYQDVMLRSLDAIHLATAHAIFGPHLTAFVTYDRRLHEAAAALGLPTEQPGAV